MKECVRSTGTSVTRLSQTSCTNYVNLNHKNVLLQETFVPILFFIQGQIPHTPLLMARYTKNGNNVNVRVEVTRMKMLDESDLDHY